MCATIFILNRLRVVVTCCTLRYRMHDQVFASCHYISHVITCYLHLWRFFSTAFQAYIVQLKVLANYKESRCLLLLHCQWPREIYMRRIKTDDVYRYSVVVSTVRIYLLYNSRRMIATCTATIIAVGSILVIDQRCPRDEELVDHDSLSVLIPLVRSRPAM